jgi:trk system potassium uptake protein
MAFATSAATASLVIEYGGLSPKGTGPWLHAAQIVLAAWFAAVPAIALWTSSRRIDLIRQARYEYGLLLVALLVGLGLALSPAWARHAARFLHLQDPADLALHLVHCFLLGNVLILLLRVQQRLLHRNLRPQWILIGSFATLIVAGTLLLLLPRAAADPSQPISLLDAFFTASSATCVTGLVVRDTGTAFSGFGQFVILGLFQAGGLGIITFVAFLALTSSSSLPLAQARVFREVTNTRTLSQVRRQVGLAVVVTLLLELVGAVCLFACLPTGGDTWHRLLWCVFHAVSAFCNAGFATQTDSLTPFQANGPVMLVFMALIILGGLGFLVVTDLVGLRVTRLPWIRRLPAVLRFTERVPIQRLPLQTRISLLVTALLLALGMVGFWFLEARHSLRDQPLAAQFWITAFQSVTCRTAGFNTVDIGGLQPATLILIMGLMVVGASPVSTGGGIKTVTFGVLLLALRSVIRGRERVEVMGRTLPARVLFNALSVTLLYAGSATLGLFLLTLFDPRIALRDLAFEMISALSTVGLSTGITAQLSAGSQLVLCAAMFVGRVGPIALVLSIFQSSISTRYTYPEEDLVVG